MGHTLLSALLLHLLNTLLYYGHAQVLDAVLMTEPNWSTFYIGESVTFICDMNEGDDADWEYKIKKDGRVYTRYNTHQRYTLGSLSAGDSGDYQCVGRRRSSNSTKSRNTVSLTVSAKPKATLTTDTTTISVGGSVTLTCSVQNSVGWKYEWYRLTQRTSEVLVDPVRTNGEDKRVISVSQGGIYLCSGTRGKPDYYTYSSDGVTIEKTLSNEAVLRRQPDWTQMFRGERITLTCEIHGGETTQWVYEWRGPQYYVAWTDDNHQTLIVSESNSGVYMCRSRLRDDSYSSTEWSKSVSLSVSDKPKAVLSVSPSWLSPGASVTLSCEVEHPSAGWRFYWYKAVPDLSGTSYSYELLPGSIDGTEQDSYIVHGKTQTAGYKCRAGRGDPEYYTVYSKPTFVWSGGSGPESFSFTVPLIIGLLSGIFLTMILLLCCCRQMKDPHCSRLSQSQNMNQASATMQTVNQNESQIYSSLLHGDASAYETIRRSGNSMNQPTSTIMSHQLEGLNKSSP